MNIKLCEFCTISLTASLNFHEILLSFVLSFLRDVENFRKVAKNFVELISKEIQNLFRFVGRRRNFQAKEILTRQRLYQQQGRRRLACVAGGIFVRDDLVAKP